MTFVLPSFGSSVISAAPASGGGGGSAWNGNTYSVDFDGTDDYLDLGSGFTTTNQFTISAWMNPDNLSTGYGYLLGNSSGTGISLDEGGGAAGAGKFYLWTGSGTVDVLSTTALTINNWFHVVFVCDKTVGTKGEIKFYINGSLDKTTTLSNQDLNNIPLLSYVGYSPNHFFNGQVDEVAIFNSALSSSNVTSIYNSGVPNDISSLNPVGWWRMGDNDGGSGTTITDQGSGGNDGTLTNGPTFSTNVPVAYNTYSLDLDGTDDYMQIGSNNMMIMDSSTGAFTWSFWLKTGTNTSGDFENFLGKDNLGAAGGGRSLLFDRTSGNDIRLIVFPEPSGSATVATWSGGSSSSNLGDNNWHNLVFVNEGTGGSLKIYFDGNNQTLSGTTTGLLPRNPSNQPLVLGAIFELSGSGANNGIFRTYDGLMDEVAAWDSALSASNITAIYNSGVANDISSLNPVGWWRMGDNDGGTGTTITDQGSGGNDGTLTNGPTFSTDVPT